MATIKQYVNLDPVKAAQLDGHDASLAPVVLRVVIVNHDRRSS